MHRLALLLLVAVAPMVSLAKDATHCRKLLSVKYEGTGADEGYFLSTTEAYRQCRDIDLPFDVRAGAHLKYAESLVMRNEPLTAVDVYKAAIKILDTPSPNNFNSDAMLIQALDDVALIETRLQLHDSAIAHATRAVSVRADHFGPTSAELASGMTRLAIVQIEGRDFAKAELLLRDAIHIAQKACGPSCDALAEALSGMSVWYHDQGNLIEAKRYEELSFAAAPADVPRELGHKE